jgi:predicted negative regulator of RcsB-dependent stress response
MDFDVLDEHEQGEVVQKWLRENAISIAVGVLLGLVLIFGWQQWKAHRLRHDAEAAAQFQALSDAVEAKRDDEVTTIAGVLRKDYSGTVYSVLAAMYQADQASSKSDLPAAAAALGWAQEHAGVGSLKSLAALRLARVKLAQGDADGAVKLVDGVPKDEYSSLGGEIRGDAFAKLGRADDARAAYQDALSHLDAQASNRSFVQMKLDDIAIVSDKTSAPIETSAAAPEKSGS